MSPVSRLRQGLPQGGTLEPQEWERRHAALVRVLWLSVIVLPIYSVFTGFVAYHTLLHVVPQAALALIASMPRFGHKARSIACSLGLLTTAAVMVHISGGLIEMHFSFFVIILLLTLYEDWSVFLVAVAYVLLHHGVLGMIDPRAVFNRAEQFNQPWKWAAIHAAFVAAAGLAGIIAWRLNEDVRGRMREAQRGLEIASLTDGLTGLHNRRKLMTDLEARFAQTGGPSRSPTALGLLDLNGFKAYNDAFGHFAGDALLARLGRRLRDGVGTRGDVYRLGGDEFCVVAPGGTDAIEALSIDVRAALREHGDGFTIATSSGWVVAPTEAATREEALRLADKRMYAEKAGGRPPAGRQVADALLRTLEERHPDLGEHVDGVAAMAAAVARRLGLDETQVERIAHAARLHDVGKVAIPDAILAKPEPLEPEEWEFIQRHTIIGERIIAAAPALTDVARLVRSSHERWDGTGYPDALAGEAIPLGARIVSACDAYDAMITDRPYQAAVDSEHACAELRRCAGTQFDPAVVPAFLAAVAARQGPGSAPEPAVV
ncbi:MAG TPA: HD domain-containing phosphohydrolase [Solirubrobacteraceae bacterium]|nr:HD domain-containing phosphohydrolase [Solirubrobacteraceae bacterium]